MIFHLAMDLPASPTTMTSLKLVDSAVGFAVVDLPVVLSAKADRLVD